MNSAQKVSLATAKAMDHSDELAELRHRFFIPQTNGQPDIYFVGNSLGLQPRSTPEYVQQELDTWRKVAVRGHFLPPRPWLSYHELLNETMANLVGGKPDEVIVMNTLTVNLHLMMATFYRPERQRHKIMIESHAFPSDKNAVQSQLELHGFDRQQGLIELPSDSDQLFSTEAIIESIEDNRDSLALILLPGVQYYTGQVFDIEAITAVANSLDIPIGWDLAHAAGNIELNLHGWNVDFACWCTYKYLNSGPGSLAGCFIHQRHVTDTRLPRLAGWWGHDAATRFQMSGEFQPMATAEGWQLSNPPILSAAAIRSSLDLFKDVGGMPPLVRKSRQQGDFFRACLHQELGDQVQVIMPPERSGCQLSLEINSGDTSGTSIHEALENVGVRTDWREPNVIRAAPTPLYNTFEDIWNFVARLKRALETGSNHCSR